MNRTTVELLAKIKTLLLGIIPHDYGIEVIRGVYEYPAQLIPAFPSITLEYETTERVDETLGDARYVERLTVIIRAYISLIDTKENYSALLNMERAIRDILVTNRVLLDYWRNSTLPVTSYGDAQIGEAMCRSINLTWTIEQVIL